MKNEKEKSEKKSSFINTNIKSRRQFKRWNGIRKSTTKKSK